MRLVVKTDTFPEYIRFELSGEFDYAEMLGFVETVRDEAEAAGRDRVLVDSRPLNGDIAESHKYFIGSRIAEVFGPSVRSALVMREGTVTKLGEMAAVNRGARLLVTDSEAEAINFLIN